MILTQKYRHLASQALLYLVPCTLWPFLLLAFSRGEMTELWEGIRAERAPALELLCPGSGESSAGDEGGGSGGGNEGGVGALGLGGSESEGEDGRVAVDEEAGVHQEEDPTGAGAGEERSGECRQRLLESADRRGGRGPS